MDKESLIEQLKIVPGVLAITTTREETIRVDFDLVAYFSIKMLVEISEKTDYELGLYAPEASKRIVRCIFYKKN